MIFNYYKIKNKVNNKVYIGITEKAGIERWKEHKKALDRNVHTNNYLQNDWNKYGESNFIFEVFETLELSLEDGYYHEYELIQNYQGEKYNIALGGHINPMYTPAIREKMIKTKQSQVPNIYQLEEIEENIFKVINIFNSQKEAGRLTRADQGNIQHSIQKHTKGCGYYWVEETEIPNFEKNWRPSRGRVTPCAELNEAGEIIEVHYSRVFFGNKYNIKTEAIKSAIQRNGKAYGKKFINISFEDYYKIKPIKLIK